MSSQSRGDLMRRGYYLLAFVVALCVIGGVVFWEYTHVYVPICAAPFFYSYKIATMDTNLELPYYTTTQGETQQFNLTFSISKPRPKISLPIGNLNLTGYNSSRYDALDWRNWVWNSSLVQEAIFNYSLSQNPIVLQSGVSNSTILTLNWARDAPTGRYTIAIPLRNFIFLEPQSDYESFGMNLTLHIRVEPKHP
jgi:hypothetical protein